MKRFSTFKTIITALFAALICVSTMLIQIPIPATGGYANLGDGVILVCAFLMHPLYAVAAAGIGSMLADLLSGFASYAPATLVIKAGVALIAAIVYLQAKKRTAPGKSIPFMILAAILAEVFMILGYFFYEAVILGAGIGAVGGILGNVGQGLVGAAVACVMTPLLSRSTEIRHMMEKTWQ